MIAPPRLAERLLRWSLPGDDRDVVLGDLQEEFGAIVDEGGISCARRWYWQQTVLSLGPNLARRVRRHDAERRRLETEENRRSRLKARTLGLLMLAAGLQALVWTDATFPGVMGFYLAIFGAMTFLRSFFARPSDVFSRGIALRRNNLFWICYWLGVFPDRIFERTPVVEHLQTTALLLGGSILFWPEKYWVFGIDFRVPEPQVWTPFVGTGRRAPDGSFRLTVDAPCAEVSIGDPIVGRAGEARIGINRIYSERDSLRIFAVIGKGAEPVRVTLDVLDSLGVVRTSSAVGLRDVELVPQSAPTGRPRIPVGQIDESVSLRELPPGNYKLRLTVADSERRAEKYADFRVAEP